MATKNKKTNSEMIEILLKNPINLHEKINLILDILYVETELEKQKLDKKEDVILKFDKSTYEQMCELMESNVIPFMGIA